MPHVLLAYCIPSMVPLVDQSSAVHLNSERLGSGLERTGTANTPDKRESLADVSEYELSVAVYETN